MICDLRGFTRISDNWRAMIHSHRRRKIERLDQAVAASQVAITELICLPRRTIRTMMQSVRSNLSPDRPEVMKLR
jgi:hypothetical protein